MNRFLKSMVCAALFVASGFPSSDADAGGRAPIRSPEPVEFVGFLQAQATPYEMYYSVGVRIRHWGEGACQVIGLDDSGEPDALGAFPCEMVRVEQDLSWTHLRIHPNVIAALFEQAENRRSAGSTLFSGEPTHLARSLFRGLRQVTSYFEIRKPSFVPAERLCYLYGSDPVPCLEMPRSERMGTRGTDGIVFRTSFKVAAWPETPGE